MTIAIIIIIIMIAGIGYKLLEIEKDIKELKEDLEYKKSKK